MNKLRVAVVGCGAIAQQKHIPAIRNCRRIAELVAVCDKNAELLNKVADANNVKAKYESIDDLLAGQKIDIVDLCTPPQTHAAVALKSIESGCHVLMEKPMALTVEDCDSINNAAESKGKKVCVIHNDLYHPPVLAARRLVKDGTIGALVWMRIYLSTPRWDMIDLKDHWYHRLPGGVIGETGPHVAYLSTAFIGRISEVDIYARNRLGLAWAPHDEFSITLRGEQATSSVILSYSRNSWGAQVDLIGTESMLTIDLERQILVKNSLKDLSRIPIAKSSFNSAAQMMLGLAKNSLLSVAGRYRIGTERIIEGFIKSVVNGSPVPVSGDEGREVARVMGIIASKYKETYPSRR